MDTMDIEGYHGISWDLYCENPERWFLWLITE